MSELHVVLVLLVGGKYGCGTKRCCGNADIFHLFYVNFMIERVTGCVGIGVRKEVKSADVIQKGAV